MPRDANGNYTLPPSYHVQTGDTLLPVQHNPPFEDVAEALTNSLARDGRTVMTGDLRMGGNKVTNVADPAFPSDAMTRRVSGFGFETRADAEAWPGVNPMPESIVIRGDASVDDGMGGTFVRGEHSSDTMLVAGESYGRIKDIAPGRIGRARREKWLLTADWQCIPENTDEITYQRAMMDEIALYHPDIDYAVFCGDIVDRASDSQTGSPPGYGYPEFFADIEERLPTISRDRWFFLPGNHDRDGSGAGMFMRNWSYETYRSEVGPEFYATRKGNIVSIFIGDMAGSNSGEIFSYVRDWLVRVLDHSAQYNVALYLHQPIYGVAPTVVSNTSSSGQYDPNDLLQGIIESYDNIMFVAYGHTDTSYEGKIRSTEIYGTTWLNVGQHIPSMADSGWSIPGVYSLMFLESGSKTVKIRRWNNDDHVFINEAEVVVTAKFPIDLGGVALNYDGRHNVDPFNGVFRGPLTIYESMAEHRSDTAGFPVDAQIVPMINIIIGDDSNDNTPLGIGASIDWYMPGDTIISDDGGSNVTGTPGYGLGGQLAFRRLREADENYSSEFVLSCATENGLVEVLRGRRVGSEHGLHSPEGSFIAGPEAIFPNGDSTSDVCALYNDGAILSSRDANPSLLLYRRGSDGNVANFYRGGTYAGGISVTGSGAAYNTSSDITLKDDDGELTFEQAREILDLITFHKFRWKSTGESDEGVFAQELYQVYPKAVSVGGWRVDGRPAQESDEGATYEPWAVDYSKLVTIIGRCVQGMMERQDDLDARLSALEN